MASLPPVIADFTMASLGLTFRDHRSVPIAEYELANRLGDEMSRTLISEHRRNILLCVDDTTVGQFRHDAMLSAKAAGLAQNFKELDEQGLAIKDDFVSDPRFPDLVFLIYDRLSLVGSFVLLKLQYRPLNASGLMRAIAQPWPRIIGWRGLNLRDLWAPMFDYFLDTNLPFEANPREGLDLVEWQVSIDRDGASYFIDNNPDPNGLNGFGATVLTGRDEVRDPVKNVTKYIRRAGERYDVEP